MRVIVKLSARNRLCLENRILSGSLLFWNRQYHESNRRIGHHIMPILPPLTWQGDEKKMQFFNRVLLFSIIIYFQELWKAVGSTRTVCHAFKLLNFQGLISLSLSLLRSFGGSVVGMGFSSFSWSIDPAPSPLCRYAIFILIHP
jgi:hypothetical protein